MYNIKYRKPKSIEQTTYLETLLILILFCCPNTIL